jgi:chromosome partitioning protein
MKGGCGKTSLAVFLAMALSFLGKRIAAIDLDHNNNLTDYFLRLVDPNDIEKSNVYHILHGVRDYEKCIYKASNGIDVIPSTPNLARIEIELARDPGALLRFSSFLRKLDYDVIIIDTPPSISFALTTALYAVDVVLCPVAWSRWTIQGYSLLAEEILKASESVGRPISLRAVPSMVSMIELEKMRSVDIWTMTKGFVSRNVAVKNAGTGGYALKDNTKSWNEFTDLAKEFLDEQ